MNANGAYFPLLSLPMNHSVLRAEKINIRKTLIRPVATYGAESRTLNKDIAKWLAAFGRKFLENC